MSRFSMAEASIVVSSEEPEFVLQAVQDLQEYVESIAGSMPRIATLASLDETDSVVVTGLAAARAVGLDDQIPADLGDQGYVLKSAQLGECPAILAAGRDSFGTAFAVLELVKSVEEGDGEAEVPPLDITEKPHYAARGILVDRRPVGNHPYAVRTWSLDDWLCYIDLLIYLKINMIQICSPSPSSREPADAERDYLEQLPRIIEYAQNRRGMEVRAEPDYNVKRQSEDRQSVIKTEEESVRVPLLQLPEILDFAEGAWSGAGETDKASRLRTLARLIAPEAAEALSRGWELLDEEKPEEVFSGAAALQQLVAKRAVGRPGAVGRFVFPDYSRVLYDLHLRLRLHGWARRVLKEIRAGTAPAGMTKLLTSYHNASLRWFDRHGFREDLLHAPDARQIVAAWRDYLRKNSVPKSILEEVKTGLLKEGHAERDIEQVLRKTPAGE